MRQTMTHSRPLVIDDGARELAARIVSYAEAHHYAQTGALAVYGVPGDNEKHVAMLGTYRVVFSITDVYDHEDFAWRSYRQLSISVPGPDYPHPIAVYMSGELFGLTGWTGVGEPPSSWIVGMSESEHCIVVVQEIERRQ